MTVRSHPATTRSAVLLLLLALSGCSSRIPRVSLAPPTKSYAATDYTKVRVRWTRDEHLLKDLDTTLQVNATLWSPDFAAAYVARSALLFKLSGSEEKALAHRFEEEWKAGTTFIVASATADYRWNDFEKKESIWHIALVNDAGELVRPQKITVEKEITATLVDFFPYIGSFYRVYRVHFPKSLPDGRPLAAPGTRQLILRFSGVLGTADLVWQLR
jgi:hypothetical protein